MAVNILPMCACHVSQVAQLEKECFHDPWSEASIAGELENPLSHWLVAMEADTVVGYVGSQVVMDQADMMNLAVAAAVRRSGIASKLIDSLCRLLAEMEVTSLTLEVRAGNDPAKALYLDKGFTRIGIRPGYYRNPREDAWILQKRWETKR